MARKPKLPSKVEIDRSKLPPITDQGDLNSGASSAIATAAHVQQKPPKRLFIYYGEREVEDGKA